MMSLQMAFCFVLQASAAGFAPGALLTVMVASSGAAIVEPRVAGSAVSSVGRDMLKGIELRSASIASRGEPPMRRISFTKMASQVVSTASVAIQNTCSPTRTI